MTALLVTAPEISDRPTLHRPGTGTERRRPRGWRPPVPRSGAPEVASTPGDPTALCCAVAHAATEALRGIRPLAQLVRSVSPEVYEELAARVQITASARERRGAPPTPQSRSRVRRARVVRVGPEAAEAGIVIDDADRVRAVALRVELHRGRWRAVVLEIG